MRYAAALAAVMLACSAEASGAACRAHSGAVLRPLVELYTSEGCNSCPPADRWLSGTFAPGRSEGAVALAFHVDYWDRLGWKDRFARTDHTARQYQAMRANRATFVYTPQVLLQGRDWRGWRGADVAPALAKVAAREPRATIAAGATAVPGAVDVEISVTLAQPPKPSTELAVAYVDSGLVTDVRAGENRGERLRHDHVVRGFETRAIARASQTFDLRLPRPAERGTHPMLVAFVQEVGGGEVLQTLAFDLTECQR